MREELLAEFHGCSVASSEGDYEYGVFEARQLPVIGGVGEYARERGVGDDVPPVRGLDEVRLRIVDCGLWDRDE